jgi:hypothetical protein
MGQSQSVSRKAWLCVGRAQQSGLCPSHGAWKGAGKGTNSSRDLGTFFVVSLLLCGHSACDMWLFVGMSGGCVTHSSYLLAY